MLFAGARNLLKRLDDVVASRAERHAQSFDREATEQHIRRLRKQEDRDYGDSAQGVVDPRAVEDYMATHSPRGRYPEIREVYLDPLNADPIPAVAAQLRRGPLHGIAQATAENQQLRRGGLAALGAGTAVLGAAALAKGAEQINVMSPEQRLALAGIGMLV